MGCVPSKSVRPTEMSQDPVNKSHFAIERVIGQGGFGKVNAVQKKLGPDKGTWYAIKTLSKSVIIQRNHLSMVMKERNLLARLKCPQLVNMHYAFQDSRNLYIIMDVCLGGDLHYQLTNCTDNSRAFSEERARFYCASIIACLEYMHSQGVVHRDIKPENLLLDNRGHLKVTDLGISMELENGYCNSTSGTRPYMAPEVFMSGHKHNSLADIYSLGITTYQFLCGQRPYRPDQANMKTIVRMATYVPPEKYEDIYQIRKILISAQERKATSPEFHYSKNLSRVSPEARDFVSQCLICNPKYRLGSQGFHELREHPWFADIDWNAFRDQTVQPPFVPDLTRANCNISKEDLAQLMQNEEEQMNGPELPPDIQALFAGYDYKTTIFAEESAPSRLKKSGRRSVSSTAGGISSTSPTATSNMTINAYPFEVASVSGVSSTHFSQNSSIFRPPLSSISPGVSLKPQSSLPKDSGVNIPSGHRGSNGSSPLPSNHSSFIRPHPVDGPASNPSPTQLSRHVYGSQEHSPRAPGGAYSVPGSTVGGFAPNYVNYAPHGIQVNSQSQPGTKYTRGYGGSSYSPISGFPNNQSPVEGGNYNMLTPSVNIISAPVNMNSHTSPRSRSGGQSPLISHNSAMNGGNAYQHSSHPTVNHSHLGHSVSVSRKSNASPQYGMNHPSSTNPSGVDNSSMGPGGSTSSMNSLGLKQQSLLVNPSLVGNDSLSALTPVQMNQSLPLSMGMGIPMGMGLGGPLGMNAPMNLPMSMPMPMNMPMNLPMNMSMNSPVGMNTGMNGMHPEMLGMNMVAVNRSISTNMNHSSVSKLGSCNNDPSSLADPPAIIPKSPSNTNLHASPQSRFSNSPHSQSQPHYTHSIVNPSSSSPSSHAQNSSQAHTPRSSALHAGREILALPNMNNMLPMGSHMHASDSFPPIGSVNLNSASPLLMTPPMNVAMAMNMNMNMAMNMNMNMGMPMNMNNSGGVGFGIGGVSQNVSSHSPSVRGVRSASWSSHSSAPTPSRNISNTLLPGNGLSMNFNRSNSNTPILHINGNGSGRTTPVSASSQVLGNGLNSQTTLPSVLDTPGHNDSFFSKQASSVIASGSNLLAPVPQDPTQLANSLAQLSLSINQSGTGNADVGVVELQSPLHNNTPGNSSSVSPVPCSDISSNANNNKDIAGTRDESDNVSSLHSVTVIPAQVIESDVSKIPLLQSQ